MKIGRRFTFPPEQQALRKKTERLSWLSIALLTSTAVAVYLTLGQSEAMKTAWIEDLLALISPIALLVALKVENREPTTRFPYGYYRAVAIAFLVIASVLLLVGAWLLLDSVLGLLRGERPPMGTRMVFGHPLWSGWAMIAALAYCVAIGILLGRLKGPVAERLNDRALAADADMNKAGWMSEGAAIAGILLIGFGRWWGDAAAAAFISLNIVRDGWINLRQVIADLMDESPTRLGETELESLPRRICDAAEQLPWVEKAAVRLRESGHVIAGEVFVVPRVEHDLVANVESAADSLASLDWRIYSLTVMPVSRLDDTTSRGADAPKSTTSNRGVDALDARRTCDTGQPARHS